MIATASCRALHRFELHHQARLQRSNPHRACRISPAHHARFPPLEAFGRRPPECAAPSIMRPASETLHKTGSASLGRETSLPIVIPAVRPDAILLRIATRSRPFDKAPSCLSNWKQAASDLGPAAWPPNAVPAPD